MRRWIATRAVIFGAVALLYSAVGAAAYGAKPETFPVGDTSSFVATDLCLFPVTINSTADGILRFFTDASGNPTRILVQFTEQDTFSANGHTLVGLPYKNRQIVNFKTGTTVEVGVIARVPLPNGKTFLSAGRLVIAADTPPTFFLNPTVGHSGDLTAFCAALA
jgi:hypothetical protein